MVDASGFEPLTPTMSRWCSNQLSYASATKGEYNANVAKFASHASLFFVKYAFYSMTNQVNLIERHYDTAHHKDIDT